MKGEKYIKRVRVDSRQLDGGMIGTKIYVTEGEVVDVTGKTKGKGFQGVIKRHGQSRGPMAHGSRYHRRPGSLGAIINKVFKGKKLPGRMGNHTRTMQNLQVVAADTEHNVLLIKGNVPGANKSFVTIRSAVKAAK